MDSPPPTLHATSPLDDRAKLKAALDLVRLVAETVCELGSIPSGTLYATLMPYGVTLSQHLKIVETMEEAGLVSVENHLITWTGPKGA